MEDKLLLLVEGDFDVQNMNVTGGIRIKEINDDDVIKIVYPLIEDDLLSWFNRQNKSAREVIKAIITLAHIGEIPDGVKSGRIKMSYWYREEHVGFKILSKHDITGEGLLLTLISLFMKNEMPADHPFRVAFASACKKMLEM